MSQPGPTPILRQRRKDAQRPDAAVETGSLQRSARSRPQPIREGMRAGYAYAHIKRLILDGQYTGGQRLDVNAFVTELEVSRQPVIHALGRLAEERFVEIVPQVGCWVARVDPAEMGDFFRLFAATEALAAEAAAERHDRSELEELRRLDRRIVALLAQDMTTPSSAHAYRMLNREFHGLIHLMAHSPTLQDAAAGMWDRCDFFLCTLGRNLIAARTHESRLEHRRIISALAKRDTARAKANMQQHIAAFGLSALHESKAEALLHAATPTRLQEHVQGA